VKTAAELLKLKAHQTVYTTTPTASVFDAVKLMAQMNVGALLVMDGAAVAGIVTERDYARKVVLMSRSSKETPVREIMTSAVMYVRPDQTTEDCMVLMTENEDEFASLHEEPDQDIQPRNFIERMYVQDIAALLWEIVRLRRFKTAILNNALRMALQSILRQILFRPEFIEKPDYELEADTLAYDWFHSQKAKTQVAKLLRQFRLDECAIEAEAFRLTSSDIDRLDRMMTSCGRFIDTDRIDVLITSEFRFGGWGDNRNQPAYDCDRKVTG